MAMQNLNPGQMLGTLVLLLIFVAIYPTLQWAVDRIVGQTSGLTEQLALLIIPIIVLAILANFWTDDRRR